MIMMMMAIHQGLMLKMKTRIQNIDIHPVLSMTIKDVRSTVESNLVKEADAISTLVSNSKLFKWQ